MKHTDRLYFCPLGTHEVVKPRGNEAVEDTFRRLRRLARSYAENRRYFRVEKRPDGVLWWRVPARQNTKLARWYALPDGVSHPMKENATEADLRAAKATARYLRRKGEGAFEVTEVDGVIYVQRIAQALRQ